MRYTIIVLWMLLCSITSAVAQVSVSIGFPGVSIGINLPVYPQLVRVPGYPVYYAPQVNSNYFFYDGLYWVYQQDNWYASSWYNGPWEIVRPDLVPLFVLRVPVRYYRHPPEYFRGWQADAPPRWNEHWGSDWERSHSGWNTWNRNAVPAPAPLPSYQQQYSGNRYPRAEQQQTLQEQHYRYQPRDAVVQQHYQTHRMEGGPATPPAQDRRDTTRQPSIQQGASPAARGQPPQTAGTNAQRPAPAQAPAEASPPAQQPPQGGVQREQRPPRWDGQVQRPAAAPAPPQQQASPPARQIPPQPPQSAAQREQQPPRPHDQVQRTAPGQASPPNATPPARQPPPQPPQGTAQREQQPPKSQGQDNGRPGKGGAQEPKHGEEKGHDKGS